MDIFSASWEKDGIPVAGIMNADELEDYLELRDPDVREQIRKSREDYRRGRAHKAGASLAKLRRPVTNKPR